MRCPGEEERKRKSRERRRPNWFLSEKVTLPTFAIFLEKKVRCGFFLSFYLGKRDDDDASSFFPFRREMRASSIARFFLARVWDQLALTGGSV